MRWHLSHRADPRARLLADRHYNRQNADSEQIAPPGKAFVLLTDCGDALWISSYQKFVQHAWPGAWNCSAFRNENPKNLSSELIREAMAATRYAWGDPPPQGMITFVDPNAISSPNPGFCFLKAGFKRVGITQRRKRLVFHIAPEDMPPAAAAMGMIRDLFSMHA